ncbi:putative membrane protein, partial [Vibrio cholerae HC-06A1]
MTRSA